MREENSSERRDRGECSFGGVVRVEIECPVPCVVS